MRFNRKLDTFFSFFLKCLAFFKFFLLLDLGVDVFFCDISCTVHFF